MTRGEGRVGETEGRQLGRGRWGEGVCEGVKREGRKGGGGRGVNRIWGEGLVCHRMGQGERARERGRSGGLGD